MAACAKNCACRCVRSRTSASATGASRMREVGDVVDRQRHVAVAIGHAQHAEHVRAGGDRHVPRTTCVR